MIFKIKNQKSKIKKLATRAKKAGQAKTKTNPITLLNRDSRLRGNDVGGFRAVCIVALFLMAIIFIPQNPNLFAQSVNDLQDQRDSLDSNIDNLNENITQKKKEASTLSDEIAVFDNQIGDIQAKINSTQGQIGSLDTQVNDINSQISKSEEKIKIQKESLNEYLKVIYEDSNTSTIELIASSNSFSDFVDKAEYNLTMQEKIKETMGEIKKLKSDLENKKNDIEKKKKEIEGLKNQQVSQRQELDAQKAAKDRLLKTTKGQEAGYQESLNQELKKQADLDAQIQTILNAQNTTPSTPNNGTGNDGGTPPTPPSSSGYMWPFPGYSQGMLVPGVNYIPFGDTVYYFPGISHTGIDIYGSSIMSASNGTVSFAGWCGGYGNCAMISNGNHLVIYGHMSSLGVSTGQSVSMGQYIGQEGSTGWSTGAHLHFEIRVNGYPVNPLNYLP
ncbi:hypothetical protein C4544_06285 [candidate division WS5 bacterium]|uniref:Uncharacterized protein n=1 Tax=candidate division WS5 bacterium TaxID=2093353 RepID=A0A419DA01_9BACT|nr:MAG: hypothetical protein C4544_06285 [candidate division WS5 bacterium]